MAGLSPHEQRRLAERHFTPAELMVIHHQLGFKAGFNPAQPRDDHGRWTDGPSGPRPERQPAAPKPLPFAHPFPVQVPSGVNLIDNMNEAADHKFDFVWFYLQVHNRGPWDYKQFGRQFADFGNFNYGAAGRAAGFSEDTLLRAAGWAQVRSGTSHPDWGEPVSLPEALLGVGGKPPFGDDPEDQAWIKRGFRYFEIYGPR